MDKAEVQDFLCGIHQTEVCINAIFSVISPQLFQAASEANWELKNNPDAYFGAVPKSRQNKWPETLESVQLWPTVCTGMSVITNRLTPSHRDHNGHHPWYDLLYSGGRHTKAVLKSVDVNGSFRYMPGTLVGICGKSLRHEVADYGGVDRQCIAHYIRFDVLERMKLNARDADWVLAEPLLEACHKDFHQSNLGCYVQEK